MSTAYEAGRTASVRRGRASFESSAPCVLSVADVQALRIDAMSQAVAELRGAIEDGAPEGEFSKYCRRIAAGVMDSVTSGDIEVLLAIGITLESLLSEYSLPVKVAAKLDLLREMCTQPEDYRAEPVFTITPGSLAHRFLSAVVASPGLGPPVLASALSVKSAALVSRVGGRLEDESLVRRVREGRHTHWYPTPYGSDLIRRVDDHTEGSSAYPTAVATHR